MIISIHFEICHQFVPCNILFFVTTKHSNKIHLVARGHHPDKTKSGL